MTKDKGELYENVPLPGFTAPEPVEPRKLTNKEADDAQNKISYRRYRATNRAQCQDCVDDYIGKKSKGINDAAYTRTLAGETRYMCFGHTQKWRDHDNLESL